MSFFKWCKRYLSPLYLGILALYIYVLFFNDNSFEHHRELKNEIRQREAELKENRDTMLYYRQLNDALNTSPQEMERIARERFHMIRPGEDIYVFVDE